MADQSTGSTLVEIAAARALQWNVEFDRGLRNPKQGAQCEAVMKLGPQLVRWSHNCVVTSSSANIFKLEPGQDRVFASAILLRLAETFRSGNNFIRVCILKTLMLELKGRGWIGETFAGYHIEKNLVNSSRSPKIGSCARALRKFRSGEEGLLTKKKIENHAEILKRIKSVTESGDPASRALALRVIGCLADLGKDSMDVYNLVLQAVHSPHRQEVSAAFFAMGCLSELSDEFAGHSLQKAFEIINSMETSPEVKVRAVRLFAKLGHSPVLVLQAIEMGRKIMLRYPLGEIITTMLISLTMLAAESSVIVSSQVDLLLTYIACDPRMNVRAIALKSLNKLVPQAFYCIQASDNIFNGALAVVRDLTVPSTLHVLALRVVRKTFYQCVATLEFAQLLPIISWIELSALCGVWPVVAQALSLLVDMVRDIKKYKFRRESSEYWTGLMELSARVCFLLCDQLSLAGLVATKSRAVRRQTSAAAREEKLNWLWKGKVSTVCVLLVKLVEAYPPVGWQVVDNLAGVLEAFARRHLGHRKENKASDKIFHQESNPDDDGGGQEKTGSAALVTKTRRANRSARGEIEVLLTELGRCLSACALFAEHKPETIENVHRRLLQLLIVLNSVDTPYGALFPAMQSLMTAALAQQSLRSVTPQVGKEPDFEKSADSKTWAGERNPRLLPQSRSALQRFGTELMQGRHFGSCYDVGKQAALSAVWDLAHFTFDGLVDAISSEGCYFWLSALSHQSKAEAALQSGKDVNDSEHGREQIDLSSRANVLKNSEPDKGEESPMERCISISFDRKESLQAEDTSLGRFGKAAAQAVPLLQNSICSLSAGVCLERMFEFQRWVLTLRLEVLECVSELVGVLARISSLDTDAGVIDLEDEWRNNDVKSLSSALRASTEQIQLLALRLRDSSEEYDLLSISFMGIDQKSVGMLSRAALFCSLLTFCSAGVLSPRSSSAKLTSSPLNAGVVALDLFRRLEHTASGDWDGLLSLAIQSGAGAVNAPGFGGSLATGPLENALVNLCSWAVPSVLALQKQHTLLGVVRGTRLLQEILRECLYLPWPSPPFFFCTRPRTGVELFLAQPGAHAGHAGHAGETEDLSVFQGSSLALSVCLQIVHAPQESLRSLKKLACGFSIQSAESNRKRVNEVYPVSKSGFAVNPALHPATVERLITHSKMPMVAKSSTRGHGQNPAPKAKDRTPDLIFSVSLDPKGQGFASCVLDVSQLPYGEYQLMFSCICVDGKSGQWILPLLNSQRSFRII